MSNKAMIIPADESQEIRVVDMPPQSGMLDMLYSEINCRAFDLVTVSDLGFWVDDEGLLVESPVVNVRATYLALVGRYRGALVGNVVITSSATTGDGDSVGLSDPLVMMIQMIISTVPAGEPGEDIETRIMRAVAAARSAGGQ